MKAKLTQLRRLGQRVLADQTGGEVIEYALIIGLIAITVLITIGAYGNKVVARWQSLNSTF